MLYSAKFKWEFTRSLAPLLAVHYRNAVMIDCCGGFMLIFSWIRNCQKRTNTISRVFWPQCEAVHDRNESTPLRSIVAEDSCWWPRFRPRGTFSNQVGTSLFGRYNLSLLNWSRVNISAKSKKEQSPTFPKLFRRTWWPKLYRRAAKIRPPR